MSDDLNDRLRLRLVQLRKAGNQSPTELAFKMGIATSTLFAFENGRRTKSGLSLSKTMAYARALNHELFAALIPEDRDWDFKKVPRVLLMTLRSAQAAPTSRRPAIEQFALLAATLSDAEFSLLLQSMKVDDEVHSTKSV